MSWETWPATSAVGPSPGHLPRLISQRRVQEEPRFGAVATVSLATGEGLPPLGAVDGVLGPGGLKRCGAKQAQRLVIGEAAEAEAESY